MPFFAPRNVSGIGVAMARVAERFYFFSILLVATTFSLHQQGTVHLALLISLGVAALGAIVFFRLFPWDKYQPRVFTVAHVFTGSALLALLVASTGGINSGYGILFFLIILFSYFYNLREMLVISTLVTGFYLLPLLYDHAGRRQLGIIVITSLFFYVGTYILYGVTRYMLKKNQALTDLNDDLSELYSITSSLFKDIEREGLPATLSESLKDHLPSTYCLVLVLDDKQNLTSRIACPVRTLTWEPSIGALYTPDQLTKIRTVLTTRQPMVIQFDLDAVDGDLRSIISPSTQSALIVPIRIAAENAGIIIFAEERKVERSPFTNEKIQLAVAISKQVSVGLNMLWCYERLTDARDNLRISHDKMIKAERLAALGEVTRAVEHEINNPLNVIVNWAEVYRDDETIDPEVRKKFQIMYDMAMRIGNVVKRLGDIKEAKSVEFLKGQKMTDIPE